SGRDRSVPPAGARGDRGHLGLDAGRGHRRDDRAGPGALARRLRGGGARLDRGSLVARRPLAPALPLVLRHAAGRLEAPRGVVAARREADRPPRPAVPLPLPDRTAAPGPADRRVLDLRLLLPRRLLGRGLLARVHRLAARARLVRLPARRGVAAAARGDAAPAARLPAADVPRRRGVGADRRARVAAALASD